MKEGAKMNPTKSKVGGGGGLAVKSGLRGGAGKLATNHHRAGLRVKTAIRAGKIASHRSRGRF